MHAHLHEETTEKEEEKRDMKDLHLGAQKFLRLTEQEDQGRALEERDEEEDLLVHDRQRNHR